MRYAFKRCRKSYWIFKWVHFNRYLGKKASGLLIHEGKVRQQRPNHPEKPFIVAGFDNSRAVIINDRGRQFLVVSTRVFDVIMYDVLPRATQLHPQRFGTRNANDVLQALYDTAPEGAFDWYKEFLRNETLAYIVEIKCGKIIDKLLRVDLFRIVEPNRANNDIDFTGGIFHVFKHYSYNNVPLSTYDERFPIEHPSFIIRTIIDGFFFAKKQPVQDRNGKAKLSSEVKLSETSILKFIFYFEEVNGFYFIDSVSKRTI